MYVSRISTASLSLRGSSRGICGTVGVRGASALSDRPWRRDSFHVSMHVLVRKSILLLEVALERVRRAEHRSAARECE